MLTQSGVALGATPYCDRTLFPEVEFDLMRRAVFSLAIFLATAGSAAAQAPDTPRVEYFRAVAAFFNLPTNEIAILGDWEIPADEISVVLFMARRSGVSPEALVALRQSGQSWTTLAARYQVGASALHVPVRDNAPAGTLQNAYARFRSTPVADWHSIQLSDSDIVGLVNVRVISQSLGLPAEQVMAGTDSAGSFVELYTQLKR